MPSPTLIIMVMDDMLWKLHGKTHKVKTGYRKLEIVKLAVCIFAYDLMIRASFGWVNILLHNTMIEGVLIQEILYRRCPELAPTENWDIRRQ